MKNNKLHIKIDCNFHNTINYKTDFKFYLEMSDGEVITKSDVVKEQSELEIIEIIKSRLKISDINNTKYKVYISIVVKLLLSLYIDDMLLNDYIYITNEEEMALAEYINKELIIEFNYKNKTIFKNISYEELIQKLLCNNQEPDYV